MPRLRTLRQVENVDRRRRCSRLSCSTRPRIGQESLKTAKVENYIIAHSNVRRALTDLLPPTPPPYQATVQLPSYPAMTHDPDAKSTGGGSAAIRSARVGALLSAYSDELRSKFSGNRLQLTRIPADRREQKPIDPL